MDMVGTMETSSCHHSVDVVILGAGYAGLMAALRLARRKWGLRIALVSDYDQLLERVRLQESIVAEVPPRVPSISAFVAGTAIEFIRGHVTSLAADQRRIRVATDKQQREVAFDQAIYALGSSIDVDGVRGAAAHAYRLEPGDGPRSAAALRSRLRQTADRPVRPATSAHGRAGFAPHRSPRPQGLQLTRRVGSGSIPTCGRFLIRTSLPLATPPVPSLRAVRPTDYRPLLRSCQAPMRRTLLWRSGRSGACSPSASPRSVKVSPSARAAWVSSVIPMTGSACLSSKVEQRAASAISSCGS